MTRAQPGATASHWKWVRSAIGLILVATTLAWATTAVDLGEVGSMLASADRWMLLVKMPALVLFVWLLRAARWHLILKALGARPSFTSTYLSTATSLGFAAVTPMQFGELLKIVHARDDHGVSVAAGAGGHAVERLADVVVVIILTVATSSALLLPDAGIAAAAAGVVLAGICAGIAAVFVGRRFARGMIEELVGGARALLSRPALQLAVWALTVGCWSLTTELWRTALLCVGVESSLVLSALLVGTVTLAGILTVVPGAIGVAEATVAAVLVQQGFRPEEGLAAALVLRFISLIAIVLGAAHWGATWMAKGRAQ